MILLLFCPQLRAASPVEAELFVPPAETYVLGDPIPLIWRFKNNSSEPLGFMWEGCCRLNGRLTVSRSGTNLQVIPPGQALAHMFAKAERLAPGQTGSYDTFVSDWVRLTETGEFQLKGRYTGVLPQQQPQVPRGLKLWKEAAETGPVTLRVITPADYLEQRVERAAQGGVELHLTGPRELPPLGQAEFILSLTNRTRAPIAIQWPADLQIWLLQNGERLRTAPSQVEANFELVTLPASGSVTKPVPISYAALEGELLGDYEIFLDLAGDAQRPRVPSNLLPLQWRISADQAKALLQNAARGVGRGGRNPALKLLRVYLLPLKTTLDAIPKQQLSTAETALLDQLQLAASLKPAAPKPGQVTLRLALENSGAASLKWPEAPELRGNSAEEQARKILEVRRHLGWDAVLVVEPNDRMTISDIAQGAAWLTNLQSNLAKPPGLVFDNGQTNPVFHFADQSSAQWEIRFQAKDRDQDKTSELAYSILAGKTGELALISSHGALAEFFEKNNADGAVRVSGPPGIVWAEIKKALGPLAAMGCTFEWVQDG